jgi:type IV secretion system T-DNA border endonuclease VirD2
MAREYTAIDKIMGRLFDETKRISGGGSSLNRSKGGSRRGGSHARPSISRQSRVGAADGKAIFKSIKTSGTQSRGGLKGQLEYIFNDEKAARIIDPAGRMDSRDVATNADINRITLNWSKNWWSNTRNGNTLHMILSYPQGTSIDHVEKITRAVCTEMFDSGDQRFKYVAAIHDDKESHPHAHVVLNRRGNDNKLFAMRPGTDRSYEAFREAMAAHAARYDIQLDPTFRFERGLTEAQPTQQEQLEAQQQQRAPKQLERTGNDLLMVQEQIKLSAITYQAMAVIAANADCDRLYRAYTEISKTIANESGEIAMPELSQDEHKRFDDYATLINDGLVQTEKLLTTKSVSERVPYEKQLSDTMVAFTALNPNADYARSLHEKPHTQSLYMHQPGEKAADLSNEKAQDLLERIEDDYGLDAKAIAARMQVEDPNQYLEQLWVRSDLEQIAEREGLDVSKDCEEVRELVWTAHEAMRQDFVEAEIIKPIPHLEPDYEYTPPKSDVYEFSDDRLGEEVAATMEHYRQGGAPEDWIADNQERILQETTARYDVERQSYIADHPEVTKPILATVEQNEKGDVYIADQASADNMIADITQRGLIREDFDEMKDTIGSDFVERNPDMPHHVADSLASMYAVVQSTRLASADVERDDELDREDPFAQYRARGVDSRTISVDRHDHLEVINLLKEQTTQDQYDRLRQGDLSAISHITTNTHFARQLALEVDLEETGRGDKLSLENQRVMEEHRENVKGATVSEIEDELER